MRASGNNQHQEKNGYRFTIIYYFEVCFSLQKFADGSAYDAERITMINGSHSLIKHLMIKSAGKIAYDTDNLHYVTFVKNLTPEYVFKLCDLIHQRIKMEILERII